MDRNLCGNKGQRATVEDLSINYNALNFKIILVSAKSAVLIACLLKVVDNKIQFISGIIGACLVRGLVLKYAFKQLKTYEKPPNNTQEIAITRLAKCMKKLLAVSSAALCTHFLLKKKLTQFTMIMMPKYSTQLYWFIMHFVITDMWFNSKTIIECLFYNNYNAFGDKYKNRNHSGFIFLELFLITKGALHAFEGYFDGLVQHQYIEKARLVFFNEVIKVIDANDTQKCVEGLTFKILLNIFTTSVVWYLNNTGVGCYLGTSPIMQFEICKILAPSVNMVLCRHVGHFILEFYDYHKASISEFARNIGFSKDFCSTSYGHRPNVEPSDR